MKTKILADFQICISVPLSTSDINVYDDYFFKGNEAQILDFL